MCLPRRCATVQMVSPGPASTCSPSSSNWMLSRARFLALVLPLGIMPASPPAFLPCEYVPPAPGASGEPGPPALCALGALTVFGFCGAERSIGLLLIECLFRSHTLRRRKQVGEIADDAGQRIRGGLPESADRCVTHALRQLIQQLRVPIAAFHQYAGLLCA